MSFIAELKRRKVLHTAGVYGVSAFGVTEILTFVFENFGVPLWANRLVASVFVVGFPIAMFLSWVFDIEPGGHITRTRYKGQSTKPIVVAAMVIMVAATGALFYLIFPQQKSIAVIPEQVLTEKTPVPDNSVAVLAFTNMSSDDEQEYFADGLSDTLIHVLAQVSGLKVTAKTSSFYFKGKDVTIVEIAEKLEVAHVLEGSIQKSGNKIRVIAQLIKASDGSHIWSKNFDRDLEDIFAVQDEIAQEVVGALKISLLDTEQERLTQRYQPTLEAYGALILGRQEMAKRTAEGLAAAEQHFKQAIELDPEYALAHVGLADTYMLQVRYAGLLFEESLKRRQPLVEKALELDPLSGEAHTAKADILQDLGNAEAAEQAFLKAIKLNPNYATARHWYRILLGRQGRFEEGLVQSRMAAELDPMSPSIQVNLAWSVWVVGRVEEALTVTRRNIERDPEFPGNYSQMWDYQLELGHVGEAQRWIDKARELNPAGVVSWMQQCYGFLHLGDVLSAEDCVNQLSKAHPDTQATTGAWLALHLYRQEWDAAISKIESSLERFPGNRYLKVQLAKLVAQQGDIQRAHGLMADLSPVPFEDDLQLPVTRLDGAMHFAAILHANGEMQQRDILFLAIEARIATMHRNRGAGYGCLDVFIHAMRGDRDKALLALREAIDVGWRASVFPVWYSWWQLSHDWRLASLRQDPEFIALINELEADIARQRQRYEENKDKPL